MNNENISNEDKIKLIKDVYKRAFSDINKIKKNRDEEVKKILKNIDNRHVNKILENIKNIK